VCQLGLQAEPLLDMAYQRGLASTVKSSYI
jgi:hypothetical protein